MSGRGRGRPPGPRTPSEKDLQTPKTYQCLTWSIGGGAGRSGASPQGRGAPAPPKSAASSASSALKDGVILVNDDIMSAQTKAPTKEGDALQEFLAMYSDDDDEEGGTCTTPSCPSAEGPAAGVAVGPDRMEALRSEWTFSVQKGSNSRDREEIVLEDVPVPGSRKGRAKKPKS
jgi:hypothetical protein